MKRVGAVACNFEVLIES